MKSKYRYLAAYDDISDAGVGRIVILCDKKIRTVEDVNQIESYIAKEINVEDVVLTNLVFLDKEWGVWDWFVAIVELVLLLFCILSVFASFFV